MILGCHQAVNTAVEEHRLHEVHAAEDAILEAMEGRPIGAILQAYPRADHEIVRKVWSDPWFVETAILNFDHGRGNGKVARALEGIDLSAVRAAVAFKAETVSKVNDERRMMAQADDLSMEQEITDAIELPCPAAVAVRTAARWPDGRPRPLFHVTGADFDLFKPLSHFGSATAVSRHAWNKLELPECPDEVRVVAAWLDISRPLRVRDLEGGSSYWLVEAVVEAGALTRQEAALVTGRSEDGIQGRWWGPAGASLDDAYPGVEASLAQALRSKGYDGIVYRNVVEGGGKSWITLDGSQVHPAGEWRYEMDRTCPNDPFRLLEPVARQGLGLTG